MFRFLRGFYLLRRFGFRNIIKGIRHFPAYLRLYARLLRDPRTPVFAKGLLVGVGVYLLSPIDVLPDVLPIMGQMDDLTLLAFGLTRFLAMVPAQVRHEHEVAVGLVKPIPVRVRRKE